jgi:anti-sigma B factor antagonist
VIEGDTFDVVVESIAAESVVVRVTGELDLATVPQLERALAERPEGAAGLVIDLSGCTFIDSTCVRLLVGVARETESAGGRAAIVATDPGILRVLEITALDTLVPVHRSVDEALVLVTD